MARIAPLTLLYYKETEIALPARLELRVACVLLSVCIPRIAYSVRFDNNPSRACCAAHPELEKIWSLSCQPVTEREVKGSTCAA